MTLHIELPIAIETALLARAAAEGKDISTFVVEVVTERLADNGVSQAKPTPAANHSSQEFAERLNSWIDMHPRRDEPADDSRESIYTGRE